MIIGDQEAPAKGELEVEVLHGEEIGGGLIALKSEYKIQGDWKLNFLNFKVENILKSFQKQATRIILFNIHKESTFVEGYALLYLSYIVILTWVY